MLGWRNFRWATFLERLVEMNEESPTPLCTTCGTALVDDSGEIFCPTCDVKEYYFHIIRRYGARAAAEKLPVGSAVVDGRNLLRT